MPPVVLALVLLALVACCAIATKLLDRKDPH